MQAQAGALSHLFSKGPSHVNFIFESCKIGGIHLFTGTDVMINNVTCIQ